LVVVLELASAALCCEGSPLLSQTEHQLPVLQYKGEPAIENTVQKHRVKPIILELLENLGAIVLGHAFGTCPLDNCKKDRVSFCGVKVMGKVHPNLHQTITSDELVLGAAGLEAGRKRPGGEGVPSRV
jgi:hypothetical protein